MRFSLPRLPKAHQLPRFNLDTPILSFSPEDTWSGRDAVEGTHIFGGIGSGKTSGSGRHLSAAFLEAGWGGLWLTAKIDERALCERACAAAHRTQDLVILTPGGPHHLNFLAYEYLACDKKTEPLVHLFMSAMEAAEGGNSGQGGARSDESFWRNTTQQLLRNVIDLSSMARDMVSLPYLYQIVVTAPQTPDEVHSADWQASSFCMQCLTEAAARVHDTPRQHDFDLTASFFLREWPGLADRTRSIVQTTFTSMADGLLRGDLYELFCTDTTITPEATHQGAIILLDLPIKQYHALGRIAQVLFKTVWQRAAERRQVEETTIPIFLWADEAHFFVTSYDALFQSTARSARVATVYLTQSIDNYYSALGGSGEQGRSQTEALLGNLQTKIFHANSSTTTNTWAAEMLAKSWQFKAQGGVSATQRSVLDRSSLPANTLSGHVSQAFEYDVPPGTFLTLAKGGPAHHCQVEGLVFQSGRVFQTTGKPYLLATFSQKD
jgi:hypothetical protein